MIQIYADGVLTYDSRDEQYALRGLKRTRGLNKGGTAEIVMPHNHPAYHAYTAYKTVVEIYRDGVLKFRGRALYPVDDFYNTRTVVCEGELCFFLDAVARPYLYQTTPAAIFTDLVGLYNSQVEEFKQFKVGTITVTDPNDYVRLESESAEDVLAVINKLLERCGGYIVFTTDDTGARVVNWLADVSRPSGQVIEAGENLFSFSRSAANTDLATGLIPYGAKNAETGERVTIAGVNGGKDYIVDEAAVAIRGTIMKSVCWDDVTEPANLLRKARQYLDECKLIVTSLQLTALDLSYLDKTVDAFEEGDLIRVISRQHGVDEDFQLVDISENMLNPGTDGLITLGKEVRTLTDRDVAGDNKSASDLQKVTAEVKRDAEINVKKVVEEAVEVKLSSVIEQTAQAVLLEVSKTYVNQDTLTSSIQTLADSITLETSGTLGGTARIKLTVNGVTKTETLDLSEIRRAFANDASAVEIQSGTLTFRNTLIVNSTNLQVSSDGTITATNTKLSGSMTTESGSYKSQLSAGRLFFYYDREEYGDITSAHWSDNSKIRGVEVRVSDVAAFLSFGSYTAASGAYSPAYVINYGVNPDGYTQRHLFYGSACFRGITYFDNDAAFSRDKGVEFTNTKGNRAGAFRMDTNDIIRLGNSYYQLYLHGSAVVLASSGTTVTSDSRKKHSIEALPDAYEAMLDKLTPVRFKFNDGTSDRYHAGFIAQEVQEALEAAGLTTQDFGGYVDLNGDGTELGLIYTEFVALLLQKIQRQEQRIAALEAAR